MFDASLATHIGGPYGLTALFAGLALAAGARLADTIVPVAGAWPFAARWLRWGLIAVSVIAVLAYVGAPGAALLTDVLVVFGSAAITAYLVHRGRYGSQPARVVAPSAAVFALVSLAAAMTTMAFWATRRWRPTSRAGSLPRARFSWRLRLPQAKGSRCFRFRACRPRAGSCRRSAPRTRGIFDLEFDTDEVLLSREAASLLG